MEVNGFMAEFVYAVCAVAAVGGFCVAIATGFEVLIRHAYNRFGFVRRFFDRIEFDEAEVSENETLPVHR